jgi:hypothetical protein
MPFKDRPNPIGVTDILRSLNEPIPFIAALVSAALRQALKIMAQY